MMKLTKDGVTLTIEGWFDKKETVNEEKAPLDASGDTMHKRQASALDKKKRTTVAVPSRQKGDKRTWTDFVKGSSYAKKDEA